MSSNGVLPAWLKSGQECDNERSEKVGTKKKDKTEKEQNTQQWKEKERVKEETKRKRLCFFLSANSVAGQSCGEIIWVTSRCIL